MPALGLSSTGAAYLSWYGSPDGDFRDAAATWVEMFAETRDPLASHPQFVVGQVSGAAPVHIGGIDTAGTVGANLGANWGLRDLQGIAVDECGRPQPVWAVDNGTQATQTAVLEESCAANPTTAAVQPGLPNTSAEPAAKLLAMVWLLLIGISIPVAAPLWHRCRRGRPK
jgi:hypothetical protein